MKQPCLCPMALCGDRVALESGCEAAMGAGFDGVELHLDDPGMDDDGAGLRGLAWLEDRAKQEGMVLAVAARITSTDTATMVRAVRSLLENMVERGARCLNLALPPVARRVGPSTFARYQDMLNATYELMDQTRHAAQAAGVAMALEVGGAGGVMSPVELRELIDDANSWAVGACLNLQRVAEAGLWEDWLVTLGRRIHAIRLSDVGGSETAGGSTGEKPLDETAFAQALDEIHYDRLLIASGVGKPVQQYTRLLKLCGQR